MTRVALLVGAALAAGVASAAAHHSIAGAYDTARDVTIEAVVTQFQFVNPHPFLLVTVTGETGAADWRLEMDNRGELASAGVRADTLRAGDRVTVRGNPSRTRSAALYVRYLERSADGLIYEQVGNRPRLRRP